MFTVIALLATSLWGLCHCQIQVGMVMETLKSKEAYQVAMNENLGILNEASKAIEDIWTIYLPELVENNSSDISQMCISSTEAIILASLQPNITMPPLVHLLDATGKIGAGLLSGNFHLVPAFDECFEYDYTSFCMGQFRLSFFPPDSPIVLIVGLCVPKYCNSLDVSIAAESTGIFEVVESSMRCTDSKNPPYSPGAIIMIVVCGLFVMLIAAGTIVDKILDWNAPKSQKVEKLNNSTEKNTVFAGSNEKSPLVNRSVTVVRQPKGRVEALDFITAFSLYKTVPTLFSTKQASGVVTSLNGIRVISMFWVILGHTYTFVLGQVDNTMSFFDIVSRFTFQPIINGTLSVDSFFFLSGVLVTYLTLRQIKKRNRFPFIHYYAHRYLRLTPTYAFLLFLLWNLDNHFAPGPQSSLPSTNPCTSYWWTNLLYINNFHPWRLQDECAGWTWYLANDMQFYIMAPLVVIPLYYLFPLGLIIAAGILFSGFIVTGTLAGVNGFHAIVTNDVNETINHEHYNDLIYTKPWGRVGPYLVGLVLGFVIYKEIRFKFGRTVNSLLYLAVWITSGFILTSTLYGLYFNFHGHVLTTAENTIYITFSRFSWGVGLALLVFACHNGYGGLINTFLSLKIWTPLSRMTLNAYLVHPVVIMAIYGQLQTAVHLTDITMGFYAVGFVVLSYAVAAVVCICVELPLGSIEILLFKLIGVGGRESQRQATKEITVERQE